jgi:pimeloyl-ACP methyl ester carboxylesterase
MISESFYHVNNQYFHILHSQFTKNRPTLLFIHGLGDSSLSFQSYLDSDLLKDFNIIIPDLAGYGKSSRATNYDLNSQVTHIEKVIHFLQEKFTLIFQNLILISHSMGGILATLLCETPLKNQIKAFINVEGSITQYGSFIAESMVHALAEQQTFTNWFIEFKNRIFTTLAHEYISIRPYYASLAFCDPQAFYDNAKEMHQLSKSVPGTYTHIIGEKYKQLVIPKIYCYGDSMCQETLDFLHENHLQTHYFKCPHHFILAECIAEFSIFIKHFILDLK